MKSIFTYPNDSSSHFIDPDYVGDDTVGFQKRIKDLKDGTFLTHVGTAPTQSVDTIMEALSKYNNHNSLEESNGNNSMYKFWEAPILDAPLELIEEDISSATAVDATTSNIEFSSNHGFYQGQKMLLSSFNNSWSGLNGDELYVKKIDADTIQLATDSDLNNLIEFYPLENDDIDGSDVDDTTAVTLTINGHGFIDGDEVTLSGFDETLAEKNGSNFFIDKIDANTVKLYNDSDLTNPLRYVPTFSNETVSDIDIVIPDGSDATALAAKVSITGFNSTYSGANVTFDADASNVYQDRLSDLGTLYLKHDTGDTFELYQDSSLTNKLSVDEFFGADNYDVFGESQTMVDFLNNDELETGDIIYGIQKKNSSGVYVDGFGATAHNTIKTIPSTGSNLTGGSQHSVHEDSILYHEFGFTGWNNTLDGKDYKQRYVEPVFEDSPDINGEIPRQQLNAFLTSGTDDVIMGITKDVVSGNGKPDETSYTYYNPDDEEWQTLSHISLTYDPPGPAGPTTRGGIYTDETRNPSNTFPGKEYDLFKMSANDRGIPNAGTIDYTRQNTNANKFALTEFEWNDFEEYGTLKLERKNTSTGRGHTWMDKTFNHLNGSKAYFASIKFGGEYIKIAIWPYDNVYENGPSTEQTDNNWDQAEFRFTTRPYMENATEFQTLYHQSVAIDSVNDANQPPGGFTWPTDSDCDTITSYSHSSNNITEGTVEIDFDTGPSDTEFDGPESFIRVDKTNTPMNYTLATSSVTKQIPDGSGGTDPAGIFTVASDNALYDRIRTGTIIQVTNPSNSVTKEAPVVVSGITQTSTSYGAPGNNVKTWYITTVETITDTNFDDFDVISYEYNTDPHFHSDLSGTHNMTTTGENYWDLDTTDRRYLRRVNGDGMTKWHETDEFRYYLLESSTGTTVDGGRTLTDSTTGNLAEAYTPPTTNIIPVNAPLSAATTGTLTIATSETHRYRLASDRLILPGNTAYLQRTGASTYVNNARIVTGEYLSAGTSGVSAYYGQWPANMDVVTNSSGYITDFSTDSEFPGAFPTSNDIMFSVEAVPDTYSAPALSLAAQEDIFDTAEEFNDTGYNGGIKEWPNYQDANYKGPSSISFRNEFFNSSTTSQNGNTFTRNGEFQKLFLEVNYPPLTEAQFGPMQRFALAVQGTYNPFYFILRGDNDTRFLPNINLGSRAVTARFIEPVSNGDRIVTLGGYASNQTNATIAGEPVVNNSVNTSDGNIKHIINGVDANIYGEVKARFNVPNSAQPVGNQIYHDPFHVIVTLDNEAFEFDQGTDGLYRVRVTFRAATFIGG